MRFFIITALLLSAAPLPAQEELPPPATHQEAAQQLVDLLVQIEQCLAQCTDEASVSAALPRLRELARRAAAFKAAQDSLPEPTTQDYIAAQSLLEPFNTAWQAIRHHIDRLQKTGLLSPELAEILVIAPEQ